MQKEQGAIHLGQLTKTPSYIVFLRVNTNFIRRLLCIRTVHIKSRPEGCVGGGDTGNCRSLSGVAIYHLDAADFSHRLPRRSLSVWRFRDGHCAEGSGT